MDRMGHSTTRAALIYLHRRPGRDKAIADALSDMIEQSWSADTDAEDPDDDGDGAPTVTG
jgi:hypothetical protein